MRITRILTNYTNPSSFVIGVSTLDYCLLNFFKISVSIAGINMFVDQENGISEHSDDTYSTPSRPRRGSSLLAPINREIKGMILDFNFTYAPDAANA